MTFDPPSSGLDPEQAIEVVLATSRLPGILIEGLYTHFPVSDTDVEFTRAQLGRFLEIAARLRAAGVDPPFVHASNSAGILNVAEANLDMVRPGGMLYGCMPDPVLGAPEGLRRVMSFHARLVQVRHLPAGWSISYGRDYVTTRDTVVGVVPVGYGHGLSRAYSQGGSVLYRGSRVPVLGRITLTLSLPETVKRYRLDRGAAFRLSARTATRTS